MEKQVTILQQFPLTERQYTDRNGQPAVFASKGFKLSDGIDTFYAEMTGEMARNHQSIEFNQDLLHHAQLQISCREFKDKDGATRYSNEIRIVNLV